MTEVVWVIIIVNVNVRVKGRCFVNRLKADVVRIIINVVRVNGRCCVNRHKADDPIQTVRPFPRLSMSHHHDDHIIAIITNSPVVTCEPRPRPDGPKPVSDPLPQTDEETIVIIIVVHSSPEALCRPRRPRRRPRSRRWAPRPDWWGSRWRTAPGRSSWQARRCPSGRRSRRWPRRPRPPGPPGGCPGRTGAGSRERECLYLVQRTNSRPGPTDDRYRK